MRMYEPIYVLMIALLTSILLGNCASAQPLFDEPTFTVTTGVSPLSTETPVALKTASPSMSPTVAPPTVTATMATTLTPTLDPSNQWCDNFDDGTIDNTLWNLPTNPELIYEQDGVLNLQITEQQSYMPDAWAGLEAIQTARLLSEIKFTMILQAHGEDQPSGAGIDVFMKNADPIFSIDVGPHLGSLGGEFSFCPDFGTYESDGYFNCTHPTPIPDQSAFAVEQGSPIQIRIEGSGKDMKFYARDNNIAVNPIAASVENFLFFVFSDPGGTIHATIDDVCVTYVGNQ